MINLTIFDSLGNIYKTSIYRVSLNMNKTTGYSIWLIPDGGVYKLTSKIILDIARKDHAPKFKPHITLLGEFGKEKNEKDIIKSFRDLVHNQKTLTLNFESVNCENFYFRALFLKVGKTKELLNFHRKAKQALGMKNIKSYMPHLSLVYGNFSKNSKEKIISSTSKDLSSEIFIKEFPIDKILLMKTQGTVSQWRKIVTFPLRG